MLHSWISNAKYERAMRRDVTDRTAMAAAAMQTEGACGKLHLRAHHVAAGIQGPFRGITFADWDFGMAVDLGEV